MKDKTITLQDVIESFVLFYSRVNASVITPKKPRMITRADVIHRINSGDCGTAAIAIGLVWQVLGNEKVIWHDNFNHAFIEVNGIYYDTANISGSDNYFDMYGCNSDDKDKFIRAESPIGCHVNYLLYDTTGIAMINSFCAMWKMKPYENMHISDLKDSNDELLSRNKLQIHELIRHNPHLSGRGIHWINIYLTEINNCLEARRITR